MEKSKFYELVKSHKFLAQKELGQNYLIDFNVCERIVNSLNIKNEDKVIEIGCGLGSLSYFLNENDAYIDLIDIDESSLMFVRDNIKLKENHNAINKNALKINYSVYNKVIGNLPYYITSSILEKVFLTSQNIEKCIFMVQKEAYERLTSKIGTEDYGPLNILLDYVGEVNPLFNVSRHSFTPEPRVDSLVFEVNIKKHEPIEKELLTTLKALFMHRRKTIYNNLKNLVRDSEKTKEILINAGVDVNARPETLTTENFVKITKQLNRK